MQKVNQKEIYESVVYKKILLYTEIQMSISNQNNLVL